MKEGLKDIMVNSLQNKQEMKEEIWKAIQRVNSVAEVLYEICPTIDNITRMEDVIGVVECDKSKTYIIVCFTYVDEEDWRRRYGECRISNAFFSDEIFNKYKNAKMAKLEYNEVRKQLIYSERKIVDLLQCPTNDIGHQMRLYLKEHLSIHAKAMELGALYSDIVERDVVDFDGLKKMKRWNE